MSYRYALADRGKTLATRPLGTRLRGDLIHKAADEDAISLDFSEVLSISHSFADEFVGRLVEEVESGEIEFDVTIVGASPEIERIVRKALERRSLALPMLA
jgi:hypothetical protein